MKNIPFFQLIFPLIKSNIKCKQSNSKSIIKYQKESCLQKIKREDIRKGHPLFDHLSFYSLILTV